MIRKKQPTILIRKIDFSDMGLFEGLCLGSRGNAIRLIHTGNSFFTIYQGFAWSVLVLRRWDPNESQALPLLLGDDGSLERTSFFLIGGCIILVCSAMQWNPALRSPRYYGCFFYFPARRPYIFLKENPFNAANGHIVKSQRVYFFINSPQ